jgi:hypothetical protein
MVRRVYRIFLYLCMKKLLSLLLLLPALAFAQSETPFKRANTIIVQTAESPDAAFRKAVQVLMDSGYGIHSADKDLMVITTTPKGLRSGAASLQVQVRENEVHLKGNFHTTAVISGVVADAPMPIEYRGAAASPLMRAWNELDAVAKALPAVSVFYK